jgi:AcrR family transcriptional regulator
MKARARPSSAARAAQQTQPRPTRELILDFAEKLIASCGVSGFALQDVAGPLGVRVPAIYKHYESRDDVLVEVARRFIGQLSEQFTYPPKGLERPRETLESVVDEFAELHLGNPAYVRLSLIDFATPAGGIEYVRRAAGGTFRENLTDGPLSAMHERLNRLVAAGIRTGDFRRVTSLDVYRVVKSSLLIRLVYPDDLLIRTVTAEERRGVRKYLWDVASRYVQPLP